MTTTLMTMGRVRSRQDIPCGIFIREYIGELLNTKEAEKISIPEYLFYVDDGNNRCI